MKVLLVDDQNGVRQLIIKWLKDFNMEILEAGDGKTALSIFNSTDIDLVITDIIMYDGDGFEFIENIKKTKSNVKIIAMSGNEIISPYAKHIGCDVFLDKPFVGEQLRNAVKSALNLKSD